jgi:hypothetical protein
MMGFQGTPARLFYDFCLDEHVVFDHMLRGIGRQNARRDCTPMNSKNPAFVRT